MQFSKLEESKHLISQASQALACEVRNREGDKDSFIQAFSKLCRAILAELLKQSVCDEWNPYSCTVDLSYFIDARHCCYHIESLATSNDVIVELKYEDALDVFKKVYKHFQNMEHFDSKVNPRFSTDSYVFYMLVWLPNRRGYSLWLFVIKAVTTAVGHF